MSKEFVSFYINDWLLPYEISSKFYRGASDHCVIEMEAAIPRNLEEVLKRLLNKNATVSIKTINGIEVVRFKVMLIRVLDFNSTADEIFTIKLRYEE
ncbi:hypothetical protein [Enterococcus sp. DIV0800]|uniref:hypothetical protein n=1 Tax=unclassified Enterococcus TaxID=2608891 RepID=UPI003D2FDC88